MKIIIHRSINQIGGCITEIESNCYKLFVDFGEQLPGAEVADTELPSIEGLSCEDASKTALFISHYHGDHQRRYRIYRYMPEKRLSKFTNALKLDYPTFQTQTSPKNIKRLLKHYSKLKLEK